MTKRLCLARQLASSATSAQTGGVQYEQLACYFSSLNSVPFLFISSLYCSDVCRAADSLAYSPAYPPSAGSSAATKAHHRGDPSQLDLFYQNIPELDIGGSLAFSTSARRNKSRSSAGKSLSSTAASSQSSSPVSAPSFDDDDGHYIPQLSDLITAKSAHARGHHHSKSAANASSPAFAPLLEASISPTLRPLLRYSRRAYSTTVRVPVLSPTQLMKHHRTPSGNLLEMARPRPPPESAPTSATTSPLLLPLSPPVNAAHYADGSNGANSTIQSARKKNRRSLPLSLAALTVRDPTITKDSVASRQSAEVTTSKDLEGAALPHFLLKSTLASVLASGGQQQPPNRHHHTQYKSVITPSHILGGSTSNWHPPQTYSQSSSSGNDKTGAETHHSHHASRHVHANGEAAHAHPRSHGAGGTNVDSTASSSDARERVTSIGTIKRPTHMTPTPNPNSTPNGNGQPPARVKHLGQFGRLGIAPSAVTPISTPSVVSVSGSFTGATTVNDPLHPAPQHRHHHEHGHVYGDHPHYQFPSELPLSNANGMRSKSGNGALPPQRSPLPQPHDADVLLSHGVRAEVRSGRRPSSRRSFSDLSHDRNEANPVATLTTATTDVCAGELVYHPTFSSSSSSADSRNRSSRSGSRRRGSAQLAMTRASEVAPSANKNEVPETEVHVVETTGDDDGMSESLSPRRASRSARRQSTIRPPLPSVSLSHSISTHMSNAISSPLSSDSRPSSPDDDDEDDDNDDNDRSRGRGRGLPKPATPMRVRRQTEGHPQRYIPDRERGREFSRGRLEHLSKGNGNRVGSSERGRDGEREGRGRSRVPPEARLLAVKEEQAKAEDRRGRSLLR